MNQESKSFFTTLIGEMGQRAAQSLISKFSPVCNPLRFHLQERFERLPGEPGSFLADPVFEASFGWEQASQSMGEFAGNLLNSRLVEAMNAPPVELMDQRFSAELHPYTHQVISWQQLQEKPPRSIIVSSGTGSGKTECFLIPILNDLANQVDRVDLLEGVQALMLYPLNALINSQRDRLRAWTANFKGSIRFSLYNGETLDEVQAAIQNSIPEQVLSRKRLRESPPPILVTNSTMLEYMLVRQHDLPILEKSQGKLRWIVLDEAHAYIGSHAAEISLLLRRVLHAFGVAANDVRFIATSATIGGAVDEKDQKQLQQYLADVAGIDPERVTVVQGKRFVPPLPKKLLSYNKSLPSLAKLRGQQAGELFETLAKSDVIRRIRQRLVDRGPMTLSEIAIMYTGKPIVSADEKQAAIRLLDLCRVAKLDGDALIPLRSHIFHRTQSGLWACCNQSCPGRSDSALDSIEWPFGKLFLERREICDQLECGSKVFELVFCDSCGAEYLAAEEEIVDEQGVLRQRNFEGDDEEVEEETLIEEETSEDDSEQVFFGSFPRLLTATNAVEIPTTVDRVTGVIDVDSSTSASVGLLYPSEGSSFRCIRCGQRERRDGQLFRPARSSAAYHLLMSIPTLLEHTPPITENPESRPFDGRRLITFSDSRQGTARFSLQAQLDAERNYARSWLYHQISAERAHFDPERITALQKELSQIEALYEQTPLDVLQRVIEQKRDELSSLEAGPVSRLKWEQAIQLMKDTRVLQEWLPEQWKHTAFKQLSPHQIARLCLIREFARRPKRQTSLETLGLVSLNYPALELIGETSLPAAWRQRRLGIQEWRDFLKIAVDFVIRGNCAVQVPAEHARWIGIDLPRRFIVEPDATAPPKGVIRWPLVREAKTRSRLPILLFRALGLSPNNPADKADVNELLQAAWHQIRSVLLTSEQDGYRLDLDKHVEFHILQEGWICPVTRRIVDVTLKGWSPYLSMDLPEMHAKCTRVRLPELLYPFGRKDGQKVSRESLLAWINNDRNIAELRRVGIWSSYSDRIAIFSHFYRINEHSAQQNSTRLRKLEDSFKSAHINILSCSTTMELGVDIGGVSSVAMNNAPPSPTNYLQRSGRAGRRKESASVSFTLCQSTPHGEAVFLNPAWPFRTKISLPHVSLQSERIIQRHINALTLTRFLQQHAQDLTKLQCGWFFLSPSEDVSAPVNVMGLWLQNHKERIVDNWLIAGLKRLSRGTPLEGVEAIWLLDQVGLELKKVRDKWLEEEKALEQELELAGGLPLQRRSASPAQLAISKQLKRMQDEYLLGELASSGFLPGYGFPTSVVPFINSTLEELRHGTTSSREREDNPIRRRGYPSRDLPIAIREYAPGTDIVIDSQVFTSEGVTLNWHIPAGDYTTAPELQSFKNAWRCRVCGSSGTRNTIPHECSVCGADQSILVIRKYLQPAGFAVNIYERPHNDLSYRKYIPVHKPWITAGQTPWSPLPRPELGRYRFSHEGHIFYQSGGLLGSGYGICLRCGKAVSEIEEGGDIPAELQQHHRLRGGKEQNGKTLCQGNEQQWAIKRNQWLGIGIATDVFELQLNDPLSGIPLNDDIAAFSLAVALRQALAEELGINDREISCTSIPSRTVTNQLTRSIVLYDTSTGGAGFVASAATVLPRLLERAREKLSCKKHCDTACHACLLTYDTQHEIKRLNRYRAFALLTNQLIDGLRLPKELHYFGPDSHLEFDDLQFAVSRELQRADTSELRIYLGAETNQWDILDWPLRSSLLKWASDGRRIILVASKNQLLSLDTAIANQLASLIEIGGIEMRAVIGNEADPKVPTLIVESGGMQRSVRWASTSLESLAPADRWGRAQPHDRCIKYVITGPLQPTVGEVIESGKLRRAPPGNYSEIVVTTQLDGPINKLGSRFWQLVEAKVPHLKERLTQRSPLAAVECRDRFLSSPINVKLLVEVLKGLSTYYRRLDVGVQVTIETVDSVRQSYKSSDLLHNDWQLREHRNSVIYGLMKDFAAFVAIRELPKHKAQHARELILIWADGARCIIRFDHGLSFLISSSVIPFDFGATPEVQTKEIANLSFIVKNKIGHIGTYFYLTDVYR